MLIYLNGMLTNFSIYTLGSDILGDLGGGELELY